MADLVFLLEGRGGECWSSDGAAFMFVDGGVLLNSWQRPFGNGSLLVPYLRGRLGTSSGACTIHGTANEASVGAGRFDCKPIALG
jgi:hypothetical protein